jgi:hypothetical protein
MKCEPGFTIYFFSEFYLRRYAAEECEETSKANLVTQGACLRRMRERVFGRTTQGCGADWDSVRPWDCDDVIKSHFIRERNLELGTVEVKRMRMTQNVNAENKWFSNNVNERQRLLNTMTRRGAVHAASSA